MGSVSAMRSETEALPTFLRSGTVLRSVPVTIPARRLAGKPARRTRSNRSIGRVAGQPAKRMAGKHTVTASGLPNNSGRQARRFGHGMVRDRPEMAGVRDRLEWLEPVTARQYHPKY